MVASLLETNRQLFHSSYSKRECDLFHGVYRINLHDSQWIHMADCMLIVEGGRIGLIDWNRACNRMKFILGSFLHFLMLDWAELGTFQPSTLTTTKISYHIFSQSSYTYSLAAILIETGLLLFVFWSDLIWHDGNLPRTTHRRKEMGSSFRFQIFYESDDHARNNHLKISILCYGNYAFLLI